MLRSTLISILADLETQGIKLSLKNYGFKVPSTITLILQTHRLTKQATHPESLRNDYFTFTFQSTGIIRIFSGW